MGRDLNGCAGWTWAVASLATAGALGLSACRSPANPAPADSAETGQGGAALPARSWDADGVEAELAAIFAVGLPDPRTLLGTFQAFWDWNDEGSCPHQVGPYNMTETFDGCTATSGYTFAGVSIYEPDGEGFWLLGDCTIHDRDGAAFEGSGELAYAPDGEGWSASLTGTWGYEASGTPWVAALPGLALWMSGDEQGATLEGSYGVLGHAVYFEGLDVWPDCSAGTLRLRDPAGGWYALALDEDCSGCGPATYGDETLGQVCLDPLPAVSDLIGRLR